MAFELLARLASYALALGLTYLMSPGDYGLWAMLLSIGMLLGPFFGGAFATAAGRWYFDRDRLDFSELVFTLGLSQVAFILVTVTLLDSIAGTYFENAIEGVTYTGQGRIILLAAALSSLPSIPLAVLVSKRESRKAGWVGVAAAFFPALGMGLGGIISGTLDSVLWGLLSGQALVGLIGLSLLLRMSSPRFNTSELLLAMAYGIPMLPHILGHWFLNSADRVMLQHLKGAESVAAYHVAYLAGFGVLLAGQALAKSWTPTFIDDSIRLRSQEPEAAESALRRTIEQRAFSVAGAMVLLGGLALVWGDEILALLLPANYQGALQDTAIIVLGNIFLSLYLIPIGVLMLNRATLQIAGITLAAAFLNVTLNALWIPALGTTGAALATLGSHLAILLLVYLASSRFEEVPLPARRAYPIGMALAIALPALVIDRWEPALFYRITANLLLSAGMALVLIRSEAFGPVYSALREMLRGIGTTGAPR
jgi:O-antigen/teichoic acid export membrane protein